ncbi:hypothetical protein [Mycobacterium sp. PSTR-4-N]|uniref:hypothetical protein n=1 Tax=Mycobacterium sp. PSTR-4-N TaxID=2917745 RepID=UPI001F15607E|nr:hypothetical protein [Mycobacterium sp. PSTR-4-N]MCG7592769.1 hypothetical protein [Mycobacterium sp. PSTR-4-N]
MTAVAVIAISVLLLALAGPLPAAQADPLDAPPGAGPEVALPWPGIGLPKSVTITGANTTQSVTVPVPSGFGATRLRGLIHAPVDATAGFVEIDDSAGTVLGTIPLPAVAPDQVVVPFDIDISTAAVNGNAMGLSFTVREPPLSMDERCGLGQQVMLSDLVAVFTGTEPAPTTVASFFPPVLQRLTIYAPIDANDAEKQAVLTLASAVARIYQPQVPAITVVSQPRGATPPAAPRFERAVVVENGDAAMAVVNPDRANVFLKVTGRGNQLSDQVSLVSNQLQSLAQVPAARVDQAGSSGAPASDEMTFQQLGISGEASVLRTAQFSTGVDRSAFGGRISGMSVHLLATHTPVSATDSASVTVSVGGQAVYTAPLRDTGRVDATFTVPAEFLRQRIVFDVDLTFSPRQLCSPTIAPVTFQLDPRSTITVQRGGDAAGGFAAVPAEFAPEFLVALDGSNPNQLDYATRIVADIAQRTGTPLQPRVVDVKAAAGATTGALIVANNATLEPTSLRPPVTGKSADTQVDLRDPLRADIANGLGSIQVFADAPRNRTVVLVTTSGAWSLVNPLFGYIDQLPDGWSSLNGDVLAAGAAGTVAELTIGPGDIDSPPADGDAVPTALWIALGCAAVAVALVAALVWRRRGAARASSA